MDNEDVKEAVYKLAEVTEDLLFTMENEGMLTKHQRKGGQSLVNEARHGVHNEQSGLNSTTEGDSAE